MDFVEWLLDEGKDENLQLEPPKKYKSYRFRDLNIKGINRLDLRHKIPPKLLYYLFI